MSIQYKRVAAGMYTDEKISNFGIQPPHPTTFLTWLLVGPVFGIVPGCASIGRYGMAEQSGWEVEDIDWMVGELADSRIIQFDPKAPFIWAPNSLKYNAPRSPLNVSSWQSDWRKLPNCLLKERAWHALRAHCEYRDRDTIFDKKKPRKATNSFATAFISIEQPPETPINVDLEPEKHSSEHSSTKQEELNRNRNRNRNSTTCSGSGETNITPIDCARAGL